MSNKQINAELEAVKNSSQSEQQLDAAAKMQLANQLSNTTKNVKVDQVTNGLKTLAADLDDIVDEVGDTVEQISDGTAIVQLTNAVGEVTADLTKEMAAATKTTIESITGTTDLSAKSFSKVVISAGTPNAVAAAVDKAVPNTPTDKLKTIARSQVNFNKVALLNDAVKFSFLKNASPASLITSFQNLINDSIADSIQVSRGQKPLGNALTALKLATFAAIGRSKAGIVGLFAFGFLGLLQNAIEKSSAPARTKLETLPDKDGVKLTIPKEDLKKVVELKNAGKIKAAAEVVKKYTDAPQEDIENAIKSIDNRVSKNTKDQVPEVETEVNDFSKISFLFKENEQVPNEYFKHVTINVFEDDGQELQNELSSLKREVTEILILGNDVALNGNAEEYMTAIFDAFKQNTSHHYIITRDGTLQRMRPIEVQSDYDLLEEHKTRSITIMMITDSIDSTTYTPKTLDTLKEFWRITTLVYPGMQVFGFEELGIGSRFNVFGPWFTPSELLKTTNLFDPRDRGPFSRDEIANGGIH